MFFEQGISRERSSGDGHVVSVDFYVGVAISFAIFSRASRILKNKKINEMINVLENVGKYDYACLRRSFSCIHCGVRKCTHNSKIEIHHNIT